MNSTRTERNPAAALLLRPFETFFALESASGLLLLFAALVALVWANSPWAASYDQLWHTAAFVGAGERALSMTLQHWINDGLMAVFFFVVGLEIKREVLIGELASPKRAALSIAAAAGGMVVPALFYAALNRGGTGAAGWGIPMATDIAFALGVLALLGSRVPLTLKIFVTAVAIVDDLGAVLVIALFYTSSISASALAVAGSVLALLILLNVAGVRRPGPYVALGFVLWLAVLMSGVHATIAGVLLALTIPARRQLDTFEFLQRARLFLEEFAEDLHPDRAAPTADQRAVLHSLEHASENVQSPLTRLEHELHPWVAFLVMPLFALANAGVSLGGNAAALLAGPVTIGTIAGLLLGKPLGVLGGAWLASRTGLAELPAGVRWGQLAGVAILCGIGFTMSLFIANLAFGEGELLDEAKVGILVGSLLSGVAGALVLVRRAGGGTT